MKVLANDGIDVAGKKILEEAGFQVFTEKIPQSELKSRIAEFDILVVRSATKVTAEIMDAGNLKLVARAGVGLDNIDMKHAGIKHIPVVNTPNASSRSVAELVFAHIFSCYRYLHMTNRVMPENGIAKFNELKKIAGSGWEVQGKKLGIIGFGRIGQEVARMGLALGMEIMAHDYLNRDVDLTVSFHRSYGKNNFSVTLPGHKMDDVLRQADIISIHTPGSAEVIGETQFNLMKTGAVLINCARGGVVNEQAMITALKSGKLAFAGVDVFENEPPLSSELLNLPNVSLSPHIGASTAEAQERVGIELANRITGFFSSRR